MEFKCDQCVKDYSRKDNLARHKKNTHGVSSTLMDKTSITATTPIPKTTMSRMTVGKTKSKKKKKKTRKRFPCVICGLTYGNVQSLVRHQRISRAHNGLTKNAIGAMVYKCRSCDKEYKYGTSYLRHQHLTGHNVDSNVDGDGDDDSEGFELTAPVTTHALSNTSMSDDGLSVLLATTQSFARVHSAVAEALKEIHEAVFPIYTKNSSIVTVNEYGELDQDGMMVETDARISEILRPYGNFVNDVRSSMSFK